MALTKQELERLKTGISKGYTQATLGAPEIDTISLEGDEVTKEGIREGYRQHLDELFRDCRKEVRRSSITHNALRDSASLHALNNAIRWMHYILDCRQARITDDNDFTLHKESDYKYTVNGQDGKPKYLLAHNSTGKWTCTCPGFKYRKQCKHVNALETLLQSSTTRLPQHLARVRQLEKSLSTWQERLDADPNNKIAQKNVEIRTAALEEAKKKAAEIEAMPKPTRHPRSEFLGVIPSIDKLFNGIAPYEIVGSWRRGKDTYKDVDILTPMTPGEWATLKDRITKDPNFGPAPGHTHADIGSEVIRGGYRNGDRVDYLDINRVPNKNEWGAWLLFRTGSAQFNIAMRGWLKKFGCSLNERGLIGPDGNVVASKTEEDIFNAIGIPFIEPKDREDSRKFYQEVKSLTQPAFLDNK